MLDLDALFVPFLSGLTDPKDLRELLEDAGFENVQLDKEPFPQHLKDWIRTNVPDVDDEELEEVCAAFDYLKVTTAQGRFGIIPTSLTPIVDLTGTGITITDIVPDADFLDKDLPLLPVDEEILSDFRKHLEQQP